MWIIVFKQNGTEHETYFNNIEDAKQELSHIRKCGYDGFILKDEDL